MFLVILMGKQGHRLLLMSSIRHTRLSGHTMEQERENAISPTLKAEFEEWGTKTTVGVLAGMFYGGAQEAASSARKVQARLPFPQEDKEQRRKTIREMTESRVLRIARGTVRGGARLGSFTALFSGIDHGLAVHRNAHDTYNVVAAGSITGGVFGLTLPGSLLTRVSSAALGSFLGATVALPLGWMQTTLQKELAPIQEQQARQARLAEDTRERSQRDGEGVDAVIRRLEARASDHLVKPQD